MAGRSTRVPDYVRVKREVEKLIARGVLRRGNLVPGERGLASKLKANVGTVRRAVQELAEEGKLIRMPRVGTIVSPGASASKGLPWWAVIVPSMEYFYPPLVHSIEEEARSRGVRVVLNCIGEDIELERDLVQQAVADGVSGVLLAPAFQINRDRDPESLEYLSELPVPAVIMDHVGNELPPSGVDCVLADNFAGSYQATVHLICHNHKKIAMFRSKTPIHSPEFLQRERGYEAALADHELEEPNLPALYAWDIDYNPEAVVLPASRRMRELKGV